ncbi:hypothetical protein LP420_01145 [Massilia sp. B-10]|nr:hypothetical protein LP420_01145 [Massilia sp. B-10]
MSPGEYSVRGGLIDLFPMGSALPYRLDLFGDEIESIRTFDADTQRSLYPVNEVRLLPGREFPDGRSGPHHLPQPLARTFLKAILRARWCTRTSRAGSPRPVSNTICRCSSNRPRPCSTICPAAPAWPWSATSTPPSSASGSTPNRATASSRPTATARSWPPTRSSSATRSSSRWPSRTAAGRSRDADLQPSELSAPIPNIAVNRRIDDPLTNLRSYLLQSDQRVMICAESNGRRETLQQYFNEYQLAPSPVEGFEGFRQSDARLALGVAPLQAGFRPVRGFSLSKSDLHYRDRAVCRFRAPRRKKKQEGVTQVESMVRDLSELKIGDPVVHINHGIGRYMGLTSMDLGEGETEFLHLEYAKDTKLYVPVSQLHVISRYSGASPEDAPLHSLGSGQWEKAKRKAAEQVRDTAAELLNLYARRAAPGPRCSSIRRTITRTSPTASASKKRRTRPRPSPTSSAT